MLRWNSSCHAFSVALCPCFSVPVNKVTSYQDLDKDLRHTAQFSVMVSSFYPFTSTQRIFNIPLNIPPFLQVFLQVWFEYSGYFGVFFFPEVLADGQEVSCVAATALARS